MRHIPTMAYSTIGCKPMAMVCLNCKHMRVKFDAEPCCGCSLQIVPNRWEPKAKHEPLRLKNSEGEALVFPQKVTNAIFDALEAEPTHDGYEEDKPKEETGK